MCVCVCVCVCQIGMFAFSGLTKEQVETLRYDTHALCVCVRARARVCEHLPAAGNLRVSA